MSKTQISAVAELRRRARELIIDMAATPTGCHLGGSLSVIDILLAAHLHFGNGPEHRIVLSKGHAAAALYATLHLFGHIPNPVEHYGRAGSSLTGHPNQKVPGVPFATGSLGHGVALTLGWALGQRLKGARGVGVAIAGDGELQEGLPWEAFQIAQAKGVGNFAVVVDVNGGQNDGAVTDISPMPALTERLTAFGFAAVACDGHDLAALQDTFGGHDFLGKRPLAILAKTVKGKGVPSLEGNPTSHYVVLQPSQAAAWKRSLS